MRIFAPLRHPSPPGVRLAVVRGFLPLSPASTNCSVSRERLETLFRRPPPNPFTCPSQNGPSPHRNSVRLRRARPLPNPEFFVGTGSGDSPLVRAYAADTGDLLFEVQPYTSSFTGGVHVAAGDINGDGIPDAILAPGFGHTPLIHVLDGKTGDQIAGPLGSFLAFSRGVTGGVSVTAADVDGDGQVDVIAAAETASGPVVRVFSGSDGSMVSQFTVSGAAFRLGITLAAADFDGDGKAEVVVGAGGSSRVRTYDPLTGTMISGALGSFDAFGPGYSGGVSVSGSALAGDLNDDGIPDIAVASGPGNTDELERWGVLPVLFPYHPSAAPQTACIYWRLVPFCRLRSWTEFGQPSSTVPPCTGHVTFTLTPSGRGGHRRGDPDVLLRRPRPPPFTPRRQP